MKADQASSLDKRIQQQGDIAIADKNFRLLREDRKIEQRQKPTGTITCPATKDRLHTRVGEHGCQLLSPDSVRPCEESIALECVGSDLDRKSALLKRETTLLQLVFLDGSRGRDNADPIARIEPRRLVDDHPLPCAKEAPLVLGDPRLVLPFEYGAGHVEGFEALARLPDLFAGGNEMLQLFGE